MKTLILIIILQILAFNYIFGQEEDPPFDPELWITNYTSSNISVKIYPVSMVFNTTTNSGQTFHRYDLTARVQTGGPLGLGNSKFIGATNKINHGSPFIVGHNDVLGLAYDFQTNQTPTDGDAGIVGFGIYKFEIQQGSWLDTFWVEWDYGHNSTWHPCRGYDLKFEVNSNPNSIKFAWTGSDPFTCTTYTVVYLPIDDSRINRRIEAWKQPRRNINTQEVEILTRAKDIGVNQFFFDGSNSMPFMQDSRRDCKIGNPITHDERGCYNSELGAVLSNFLSIRTDVTTLASFARDQTHNCIEYTDYYAKNIVVLSLAILEIYNDKTLTMRNYLNTTNAATMTIKGDPNYTVPTIGLANLIIRPSAELIVQSNSTLVFDKYSTIYLDNGSKIRLQQGARFFNKGAIIGGKGQIIGASGPGSDELVAEDTLIFRDSVNVVLQDSAKWNVERNSVIIFDGPKARLICNPVSAINFGKNSKMVFKNGAGIYANNSKFTSSSADSTWDGIYLSDLAYDTLKNCTIENAYNGINIEDKTDLFSAVFATEISNCTFKNTTSTDLLNYVYVNNSSNVLIKDCNSQVISSGKFTSGIITEYCPSNGVIIVDNDINMLQQV